MNRLIMLDVVLLPSANAAWLLLLTLSMHPFVFGTNRLFQVVAWTVSSGTGRPRYELPTRNFAATISTPLTGMTAQRDFQRFCHARLFSHSSSPCLETCPSQCMDEEPKMSSSALTTNEIDEIFMNNTMIVPVEEYVTKSSTTSTFSSVADESDVTSSSALSSPSSFSRVLDLMEITWTEWILPVGRGLWMASQQGETRYNHATFPSNWDDFWNFPLHLEKAGTELETMQRKNDGTCTNNSSSVGRTIAQQFTHYLERLGVTFVKFGQALSARPDIIPRPLALSLSKLQDEMDVASSGLDNVHVARNVLRQELLGGKGSMAFNEDDWETFMASLSESPVAAASIGVVYSARSPHTNQKVAIKIQRPGIEHVVQQDAQLLRWAANFLESIPALPSSSPAEGSSIKSSQGLRRLIQANLTGAVDEFMSRILEELDYHNEKDNLEIFGALYSHRRQNADENIAASDSNRQNKIHVVVPKVYPHMCTNKVLVMEWIDGVKLVDLMRRNGEHDDSTANLETLDLIKQGIDCTLSQLLETGILHADPHGGNLLKVMTDEAESESLSKKYRLGYVDFGLLSSIPSTVQEGLICAVAQLVFARNVTAVACLFSDLELIPKEVLEDPSEQLALAQELERALSQVLVYENNSAGSQSSPLPTLRFAKLLDVLVKLVPRFQFQLPPYFLNNARALSTLEGMAREADPTFNVLQILYPYAIRRLFTNPNCSKVVDATLDSLVESPHTGRIDPKKLRKLLEDASLLSGYSHSKVAQDVLNTKNGSRLARRLVLEQALERVKAFPIGRRRLKKMSNYLRL